MLERRAAPLREQAVVVLRESIVAGDFRPGERLTEKRLEAQLGVSRTVVREALRQLESERLVRIEPQVGPIVAELTPADVAHLYEVRAALEGAASRLAARNATSDDVRALERVLTEVETLDDGAMADLIAVKNRFYAVLIGASGNPVIGEMLDNVQARISQLRAVTLASPGRKAAMVVELRLVVGAIAAHDEDAAFHASVDHTMRASELALTHLATEPQVEASAALQQGS